MLSQYLADVVQKGLDNVLDNGGDIAAQVALTNQIVTLIQTSTQEADFAALSVAEQAEQLLALLREADPRLAVGKTAADLTRPETSMPLADQTLLVSKDKYQMNVLSYSKEITEG